MRFGFFDQLPCASGDSEQQRYRDIIAQIELGDALGFDTVWLGELHFSRAFSILAAPLMVLAAAAQRTTRIRLGTAVTLLPLHHPVKTAWSASRPCGTTTGWTSSSAISIRAGSWITPRSDDR
jgi:alkanesulfonate monooxygenase SsuD/methylene tetrahydromethanopterin reductase-like flavin-dependent oxidoreductase (luciferase family)